MTHITEQQLAKLHTPVASNTENGACLTGHNGRYAEQSCSYRWQAHEISKAERTAIYNVNVPSQYQGGIATSAYRALSGMLTPAYYDSQLTYPQHPGDWFLTGPSQPFKPYPRAKQSIPAGKNFTKDTWPYWHNAHHLIPKGLLNNVINTASCAALIKQSLLEAKYNVNHKINMMILPQDKEVAKILKLPRHLILKESSGRVEVTSHQAYDAKVEEKLEEIVDAYKKLCDQAKQSAGPHGTPKPTLDKAKLEKLSKDLYKTLSSVAPSFAGEPISDLKAVV